MNMLRYSLLLLFRPSRFVKLATRHAIEHEFSTNKQYHDSYPGGVLPSEEIEAFSRTARSQTSQIRSALLGGILSTFVTMLFGTLAGVTLAFWVGPPSKLLIYSFQAVGAAVILGTTLGEIGRDIQTWDGGTLPERVNTWTFRAPYVLGTLLFMVSFSWDAAIGTYQSLLPGK